MVPDLQSQHCLGSSWKFSISGSDLLRNTGSGDQPPVSPPGDSDTSLSLQVTALEMGEVGVDCLFEQCVQFPDASPGVSASHLLEHPHRP